MTLAEITRLFAPLDAAALALLVVSWLGITWIIERPPKRHPSVSTLMMGYRRDWMVAFVTREPRIFDAQIVGNLRQGTAFFGSAALIAIGGGLAIIGNTDQLIGVAEDLALPVASTVVLEVKLLVMLLLVTNGFLKFVWSNRLFGYCAVVMASVPNDPADPRAYPRARKAAEISITAARAFNRGLRSVYFALASATWLLGPAALIAATLFTVLVIWRREFASQSREVLMEADDA